MGAMGDVREKKRNNRWFMVNVLIPTKPDDIHAIYTQLGLRQKGHQGLLWYTADFPIQQVHSFELLDGDAHWYSNGVDFDIKNDDFDVVWYRRPRKPTLSKSVRLEDKENAEKECGMLFQTFWNVIAPNAMWINPPDKIKAANSKLLQLKVASKVGLKVPTTLISNDPIKIKNFFAKDEQSIIYKTLYPMHWIEENGMRLTYTKEINRQKLPSDAVLKMTPAIFQKKIQKAYELRITYFGNYSVAVKLHSQKHPMGLMDWRCVPIHELMIEEYKLPKLIDQQCKEVMRKLGIVFGCFDFIVTPDNQYYFLEVNESGQFLWIEILNPKIKMLDIFTDFLINKNPIFNWVEKSDSISLASFQKVVGEKMDVALELHINSID